MASLGLMRAFHGDVQESLTHLEGMGSFCSSLGRNLREVSPLGSGDSNHDVLQVASTSKYENLQKPSLVTLVALSFACKVFGSLALMIYTLVIFSKISCVKYSDFKFFNCSSL